LNLLSVPARIGWQANHPIHSAAYCTSVGEDRSEKNRLLLETIQPTTLTEEPKDPYK
jgi:hypothetical protein